MRSEINAIVRKNAMQNGWDFEKSYNDLYDKFNAYAHVNIGKIAEKNNCRKIEAVEKIGQLALLLYFAKDMYTTAYAI